MASKPDDKLYQCSYDSSVVVIRDAALEHIGDVKRLTDANRSVFGFVVRAAFEEAWREGSLLVAISHDTVVGFVRYHHRKRDSVTTLYDICVAQSSRRRGIGRQLMRTLIARCETHKRGALVLKCPAHLQSNGFYAQQGFILSGTLPGKRGMINVWRLELSGKCEI